MGAPVLLLHGFPGNEKNLDLAQDLRADGFNVLFFHYRGAWGSEKRSCGTCGATGDVRSGDRGARAQTHFPEPPLRMGRSPGGVG